jgi:hypothetical protein
MATSNMGVMSSLFGPALTQGQYRDNYLKDSMITPREMMGRSLDDKIFAIGSNAGGMLGYGVGKLLGGQTPEEAQNEQMRGMLGGVNMNDPESLFAAAQNIQGMNPAAAQALVAQATDLQTKQVAQQKSMMDAQKIQAEMDAKAMEAAEKAKRAQSLGSLVQRKLPDLSPEEATALGADETFVRELFKNPKKVYKTEKVNGQLNVYDEDYNLVKTLGSAGKSLEESLGAGLAGIAKVVAGKQAEAAASKGGQVVGEAIAKVQSGYQSLDALQQAASMVDAGIFAGGYGPVMEGVAKYTGGALGSQARLENTEQFRSYIGKVVIPMMSQLGGSDSNEELRKMEKIMAGDTTLEPGAIKTILKQAQAAVRRDLARLEAQQKAVAQGEQLPIGPVDAKPTPTATKRFNRQTGKIEPIGGN